MNTSSSLCSGDCRNAPGRSTVATFRRSFASMAQEMKSDFVLTVGELVSAGMLPVDLLLLHFDVPLHQWHRR